MAHFSGKLCPSFRPSRNLSSILLILLLSAFSPRLHAQTLPPTTSDDQMGDQAYQSYHGGDIDSVSLTNGTLSLNFPFLSYPQRGALHLGFNLMYNNQPQHQGQFCAPPPAPCVWLWGYPTGTGLPVERGDVYVSWGEQIGLMGQFIPEVITDGKLTTDVIFFSNWSLQMADGSKHPLGNMGGVTWTTNAVWCGASGYQSPDYQCVTANGPFETLDATGWRLNGAINPCLVQYGCNDNSLAPGMTAVDSNGIIYGNGTQQDSNGNEITTNAGGILDSLGRQIPVPPTNSSSGNTSTSNCPVISGETAATKAVLWAPPLYNSGTQQYTFCYASFPQSILGLHCNSSVTLLQSIVLPNGQSWQFQYNDPTSENCSGYAVNYATLSQITLPTGGTISYTYLYGGSFHSPSCQNYGRWVSTRTVNANDGTGPHSWTYTYNSNTVVTDPLNNDVVHTFGAGIGCALYETQTQYYQGSHSSGTLLKTVNTTYSSSGSPNTNTPINVVPTSVTVGWPNGQTSQVTRAYDSGFSYSPYSGGGTSYNGIYGKQIKEQAYDYPNGTSLLRTTTTGYAWQSNSNYLTNNLLNLPSQVAIFAGTGGSGACGPNGAIACTTYGYDEAIPQTSGISEQKVSGESYPGNQTSVHRWLNGSTTGTTNCAATNGYLVTTKAYYDTGEVPTVTDPCGYQTNYQYSGTYYGAFVTKVTNALGQNMSYGYDFNTGAVTSITDWNSQITNKNYDMLTRLLSASYPDGGSTTLCYTDGIPTACPSGNAGNAPFAVVVKKAITSSTNKISTVTVDGLGRSSQAQLNSDPDGTTYTLTTYDALGRKSKIYNPTRCSSITSNCNNETTWGVASTNYDPLGRVTSVVEQDGSTVSTNYSAFPCTTVTDEAGHSRRSCVDALGRMTGVWEDPSGLNYETDYQYDGLSNLTNVTQKGSNSANSRNRTFQYDSLSRLTSATNPESGTILYAYDADSNLVTKTTPSPNQPSTGTKTVATTYTYDTLNRLTGKSYNDTYTQNPATPSLAYGYDGIALSCPTPVGFSGGSATNGIGRRTAMCYDAGSKSWAYDPMGRILSENDRFIWLVPPYYADEVVINGVPTLSENTQYAYYLNGDLYNLYYPGPKGPPDTEFYTTENAAGRVITAGDSVNDVLGSATYTPGGQLATAVIGRGSYAGSTISNTYNNRLQPVLISASTASESPILNLTHNFNLGNGDNGNVIQIANGKTSSRTQNFTYDSLNRIATAYTNGTNWGENYTIDAWGNLTNIAPYTGKTGGETLNCAAASTKNQLNTCLTYDAAGNVINNGTVTYTYDAENRLIATGGMSYVYDGDGQRVEKCTEATTAQGVGEPGLCASNATGTLYWLHAGGGTLAESDLGGNWTAIYGLIHGEIVDRVDIASDAQVDVRYYFHDHLGTSNVVTDASGNIVKESDYYPYGGEIAVSGSDANRYKFTSKERDPESGLDHFQFRNYSSSMGRWMIPDPAGMMAVDIGSPQTLNRYSYVLNNPLSFTDPFGLDCAYLNSSGTGVEKGGIDQHSSSGECGKTGGYWVEGSVTNVSIGGDSETVSLTGTTNGTTNNTSASYQQNATFDVGEFHNTFVNRWNHIALGLHGGTLFGQNPRSDSQFGWQVMIHNPANVVVPGAIKPQTGGQLVNMVHIPVTGMQAQMMQDAISQSQQNPPPYSIGGQGGRICDCASWAQQILGDAGINSGPVTQNPGTLIQQLQQEQPPQQ
jgi:RHS repeat-associated protein